MIKLDRDGEVFILRMQSGENRYNRPFLDALNSALDEVERSSGPAALVTTGEGKFYSNGLDLAWLMSAGPQVLRPFVEEVHQLFARLLAFPMCTVAAVNGHVYAGGAMLALAHDYRIMRSDRGYFCLPEIDLKLPFTPAMTAVVQAKLPKPVVHEAMVFGKRYGGMDCAARGIADAAEAEADMLPKAVALARQFAAKDRGTMAAIKKLMYGEVIAVANAGKSQKT